MAKEIKVWPSWAFHFATYTGLRKPVTDQHATRERGPLACYIVVISPAPKIRQINGFKLHHFLKKRAHNTFDD